LRPCPAIGAKKNFAALPTIPAEFEVKNKRKSAEEAKVEHLLFVTFIFRSNKIQ